MDPAQITQPRPERNAVEVFLLLLALQSAVMPLLRPAPSTVAVVLGPVWAAVWTTGLLVGALVTLAGLFWPGRLATGLLVQQLGYAAFAPMSLARAVALFGVGQTAQAVTILAFAIAATIRLVQLEHRLGRRWWLPYWPWRRGSDVEA